MNQLNINVRPLISILTPAWNRASYLQKVWDGLCQQTYQNFEWIVANDGSEDTTIDVVKNLADKSHFPVTLINADQRVGKSRMDNELVKYARGEFILWCDSDDVLLPNAVEKLLDAWEAIPNECRNVFSGVTALCDTKNGLLGSSYPVDDYTDIKFNDLLLGLKSDLVIFTRSNLLKANPFPEVDFLISESAVWCKIGELHTRFIPVVLKRVNYQEVNCISYSGLMEYNRGKAHAMAITRPLINDRLSLWDRIVRLINYERYCIHGEIRVIEMVRLWNCRFFSMFGLLMALSMALPLVVKDHLQGKVRKTHREFEIAIKNVKIDIFQLNR